MKKILKWVAIVVVGFFVAMMALGFYIQSKRTPEEKAADEAKIALARAASEQERAEAEARRIEAIPKVSASEIAIAYNENTVAADQRFKGKEFRVTGSVGDINTDVLGYPYVTLRGGVNEFMEPQFAFDKSDSDQLAKLKKGDRVTLACKGKGDIAKIPMSDSCKLIRS